MRSSILSLAIPTYNRADILISNLQSILDELIEHQIAVYISDDSNDEKTAVVIRSLVKAHPLIFYFRNHPGLGHDRNCIRTLSLPEEDYIWYMGDSMILKKGTISKMLKLLSGGDFDFVSVNCDGRNLDIKSKLYTESLSAFSDVGWHLTMTGATIYKRSVLDLDKIDISECSNFPQLAVIFKNFDGKRLYWINERLIYSNPDKKSYWNNRVLEVFVTDYYKTLNYILEDKRIINHFVYQHAHNSGLLSFFSLVSLVATGNINSANYEKYRLFFKQLSTKESAIIKTLMIVPKYFIRILNVFLIKQMK